MMTNTAADRYRPLRSDRWTAAGLALLPFLVFMLSRPYIGIMHDARLYVGYALSQLDPMGIGQDLVFTADGQSGYSIYPLVLREMVRAIGPSKAAMVSALAGLCVWFTAFYGFASCWLRHRFSPPRLAAAIFLALSVSHFYGGTGVFKFAEPYATPRVFAESLVLLALTMLMSGRSPLLSAGPLLLAAALHPIMTAPAIALALWWVSPGPRTRLLLIGLVAIAMLVVMFGGPLLGLDRFPFTRFDPQWRSALDGKKSLVFLRWWYPQDFTRTILQLVTVGLAATTVDAAHRRMITTCAVIAVAALAASALGADVLGNVLVAQAQPWRALWIVAVLAALSLPLLVHVAWGSDSPGEGLRGFPLKRASILLLMLAWVVVEHSINAGALAVLAALLWLVPMRWPHVSLPPNGTSLISVVVIGLALFMVGTQAWITSEIVLGAPRLQMLASWNYAWMTGVPGIMLAAIGLVGLVRSELRVRVRPLAASIAFLLLLVAGLWDSRTAYQQQLEHALDSQAVKRSRLTNSPIAGPALWPFSDMESWAFLGRPSWGTPLQGIPAVFNRELALVWTSRWNRLRAVGLTPSAEGAQELVVSDSRWDGLASLQSLCTESDSPELLILPSSIPIGKTSVMMEMPEPKLLQPAMRGAGWVQIDRWQVVECVDVRSAR